MGVLKSVPRGRVVERLTRSTVNDRYVTVMAVNDSRLTVD